MSSARTDEQWVTVADAAKRLGKDTSTIRRHLVEKKFESRKAEFGWYEVPWLQVQSFYVHLAERHPSSARAPHVQLTCNARVAHDERLPDVHLHEKLTHDAREALVRERDFLAEALKRERERSDQLARQYEEVISKVFVLTEEVTTLSRKVVALLPPASKERHCGAEFHTVEVVENCEEKQEKISVSAAAEQTGRSPRLLRKWIEQGRVRSAERKGAIWYVSLEEAKVLSEKSSRV